MHSIRMSLFAFALAMFGACTQVDPPASTSPEDEVNSTQSELEITGPLANSLQTCLSHCQPDDDACRDCCRCLAHGGTAPQCCM